MSIKSDLKEISSLEKELQLTQAELYKNPTSKWLQGDADMWQEKINLVARQDKYVKISHMIKAFAKLCKIEEDQVVIRSCITPNPCTTSKVELFSLLKDGMDYYKLKVVMNGKNRKLTFCVPLDPRQTLEDGKSIMKHIKINKNGQTWFDLKALPMLEAVDNLDDTVMVKPAEYADGEIVPESCGKLIPRNLYGMIFVNALIASEKEAEKGSESDGEERE